MSRLYLVATPIGNLEDITHRALRVLDEVPLIAAEDTRQTHKLLAHYKIETVRAPISYHEHNKKRQLKKILSALDDGDVALVSDAGTPGINDPGYRLTRAAVQAGHTICPIPGPSAPLAALIASGLPTDAFLYQGYLPRKSAQRKSALADVASLPYTLIFLETPHRLLDSLDDLREVLGNREIAVARELTKLYEEIFRGRLEEACAYYAKNPPRGEITLVVAGAPDDAGKWSEARLDAAIKVAISEGGKPSKIARQLAKESGWPRREVYDLIIELK
ncbi:MAG: 16S rRNA (cytidine(1402)-2'-O)-methyltransferase [Chloroflexota bacterium]|nr:16S rRNA (cytidine(1402)-2'-O)-methyltransferase [Chloroflexota bacterium]